MNVIESRCPAEVNREVSAGLGRGSISQSLNNPVMVIAVAELGKRVTKSFEVAKGIDPEQLFFEGAEESLDAPVSF